MTVQILKPNLLSIHQIKSTFSDLKLVVDLDL